MSGGIKTPYYRLVFADAKTQWTYRIDAVLGIVLEKKQKETATTESDTADFISLEEAKKIALKDAGLDESTQKNRVHQGGAQPQFRQALLYT